jgi:hypothetical protein
MIDPGKDSFQAISNRQICELYRDIIIQQRWVSHKALVKIDASLLLNPIKNRFKGRILNIGRHPALIESQVKSFFICRDNTA